MNISDMPDVEELRAMARSAFEALRGKPPTLVLSQAASTLVFVQNELRQLGSEIVYHEENRRHELLKRGYLPPEDLARAVQSHATPQPEELTDAQCDELRRSPGSFNDMVRAIYQAGWDARGRWEQQQGASSGND